MVTSPALPVVQHREHADHGAGAAAAAKGKAQVDPQSVVVTSLFAGHYEGNYRRFPHAELWA